MKRLFLLSIIALNIILSAQTPISLDNKLIITDNYISLRGSNGTHRAIDLPSDRYGNHFTAIQFCKILNSRAVPSL